MRRRYQPRSHENWNTFQDWPFVAGGSFIPYVPLLQPNQPSASGVGLSELSSILSGSGEPIVERARSQRRAPSPPPSFSGNFPPPPKSPGEPPPSSAEPQWRDFQPKTAREGILGALSAFWTGAHREARRQYEVAHAVWEKRKWQLEQNEKSYERAKENFNREIKAYALQREKLERELEEQLTKHATYLSRFEEERAADEAALARLISGAAKVDRACVERLAAAVCLAIPLPLPLPRTPEAHFDEADGILLLDVAVPNVEEAQLHVQLKTKLRAATAKEVRTGQELVVQGIALRILHEIFSASAFAPVQMVGVNLTLSYTNRRNGSRVDEVIASLVASRPEFSSIDIAHVDPKLCFRSLKGVVTPSFEEPAPIRPLLQLKRDDGRIVEGREIVDHLKQDTNLAALDWEDFEHIVRELFAKLFSERSQAEVHVTRASRDYGVDALIFDPDPIHGGKFVIQAKRYVNTVDVAAVRDLYGTLQNEGANRGYLVTTSSFGPDAYSFAKDKPITLIDGQNLLGLLKQHGYAFRIDLHEARRLMQGGLR